MSGRRLLAPLLAVAMAIAVGAAAGPTDTASAAVPRERRVVMFADSVGLGARGALPRAFPADWQVVVDGQPARFVEQLESQYVRPRLATNPDWFGDHVVIAAGYNYPYWDPDRFARSVDSMIETLVAAGVEHVYWVTLRDVKPQYVSAAAWRQVQPYYWYFPEVNDHLEAALDRHPELRLVDWAAAADRSGITYDAIHLNTEGAALYSSLVRNAVEGAATAVAAGSTTRVHLDPPDGATAAAVNVTTTHPRTTGFLTLHRCDAPPPVVSQHNHVRGQVVAHAAIVPIDDNGDVCITSHESTNLIVDVTGFFDGGYLPASPTRWHDTRRADRGEPLTAGAVLELDLDDVRTEAGLPVETGPLVLNVTAVRAEATGWLRVVTCGSDAETSNVNFADGAATPNLVVVEPDADGRICVTTSATSHVVVDLFGAFAPQSGARASEPVRLFDSRGAGDELDPGDDGRRRQAGTEIPISIAAPDVTDHVGDGAILNLTGVRAGAPGFLTAYPCSDVAHESRAERPTSSNLNVRPDEVVANVAIVAIDHDARVCTFTSTATHLVIDYLGHPGTSYVSAEPRRVLDTRG